MVASEIYGQHRRQDKDCCAGPHCFFSVEHFGHRDTQ